MNGAAVGARAAPLSGAPGRSIERDETRRDGRQWKRLLFFLKKGTMCCCVWGFLEEEVIGRRVAMGGREKKNKTTTRGARDTARSQGGEERPAAPWKKNATRTEKRGQGVWEKQGGPTVAGT